MRHKIQLKGLKVWGYHGVLEHEKLIGQEFVIDATIFAELPSRLDDNLANTVNYAALADALVADATSKPVDLIETLAQRLAAVAMKSAGKYARKVEITVHKPNAPISAEFENVSVTIKVKKSARIGAEVRHV
ncbi:MAG: hypothetical protein RL556_4 [Actinomycetota bacterium]|jgi:dihydroneopterin aldolase